MQIIFDDNQKEIKVENFFIFIAKRSDEIIKEASTIFIYDKFYFDKKVK